MKLQSYDWPGNIRELRNVIERAVILARGGSLEFDLPIQTGCVGFACVEVSVRNRRLAELDEPEFLTEAELQLRERDNLLRILQKTNWKIKGPDGAAELLGVKPTTLLSRIEKWDLKSRQLLKHEISHVRAFVPPVLVRHYSLVIRSQSVPKLATSGTDLV